MRKKSKVIMRDIFLNDSKYEINVLVNESLLAEQIYFTLEGRYAEEVISLHSKRTNEIEERYEEFTVEFDYNEIQPLITEGELWDLYFNIEMEEEVKIRVKSNFDTFGFNTLVLPETQKMFYPYTTKNGNISFCLNEIKVSSVFESAQLHKNNISFEGFFVFPPSYKTDLYHVENVSLIVKNNINDEETQLPLEQFTRDDFAEKYEGNDNLKNIGVKGSLSLLPFLNIGDNVFLKFYFELTYRYNDDLVTIRSPRMRLNYDNAHSTIRINRTLKGSRYKIVMKPTKRSKFLSVQLKKFSFRKDIIGKAKSKIVRLRRSNKTRKLYAKAFAFIGLLPAKKKLIVFESFHGKQFSDSPRAIYEYLSEHYPKYDMYWSVDRSKIPFFKEKGLKVVRRYSISWLFKMARAKYWVINNRLPLWVPKPKHTVYLQTWHGTPLKRLAADMDQVLMPGTNTKKYKRNFTREASRWDYLVSPNAYSTEIFTRAFKFEGKMIESGYPRNDFLITSNESESINNIKKRTNLPLDKKVILYAPTWRDNQFYGKGKYKFDIEMDLALLREELGDDYVILLRLHYLVAENLDLTGYEGFVYDFSAHEDIRELYLISDILITDYSSVFFDYANLKRPMIFYVFDLEDYRDNLRGFYFDFEEKAPGPLVKTTEEIIKVVRDLEDNNSTPSGNVEEFYNKFCYLEDGQATSRVVEEVFK